MDYKSTVKSFCYFLTCFAVLLAFSGCGDVKINGTAYSGDAECIAVTDENIQDYSVFNKLKKLKTLDLTAVNLSTSDYDEISSVIDDRVEIIWNVPFDGQKLRSTSKSLDINADSVADASFIQYFTQLNSIRISSTKVSEKLLDVINAAKSVNPDVVIRCSSSAYGAAVDDSTGFLDLNAIEMDDLSELGTALRVFPNLHTVEICSCVLDNETIAQFTEQYPDKKIVWLVKVDKFRIRSDAQAFSTLRQDMHHEFTSEVASPIFKYCTELRALDLGHNNLTDISGITNLKHLHTLILTDNAIKDITPLTELKELNYVELYINKIKDATPLGELPLLEDLNMRNNKGLKNTLALLNCKKLKKLVLSFCEVDTRTIKKLESELPKGCYLEYSSTAAWRFGEKNSTIRHIFRYWYTVKEFPDWENVVYDDNLYSFSESTK